MTSYVKKCRKKSQDEATPTPDKSVEKEQSTRDVDQEIKNEHEGYGSKISGQEFDDKPATINNDQGSDFQEQKVTLELKTVTSEPTASIPFTSAIITSNHEGMQSSKAEITENNKSIVCHSAQDPHNTNPDSVEYLVIEFSS